MDRVGGSLDHFLSKARALRKGTAYMGRVSNAATCVAGDNEIILIMTKGNSGFLLHTQQGSCSKSWKFTIEVVNVVNVKSIHTIPLSFRFHSHLPGHGLWVCDSQTFSVVHVIPVDQDCPHDLFLCDSFIWATVRGRLVCFCEVRNEIK